MVSPVQRCRGYSLAELLVVLVIVGILAAVGVTMLGNRPAGGVRTILDELEGELMAAHKDAVATGRDVFIGTMGDWEDSSLILGYRPGTTNITATELTGTLLTDPNSFRVSTGREHMHAGIVTPNGTAKNWWNTTMKIAANGKQNDDITKFPPFNDATSGFQGILTDTANLFQGSSTVGTARISGASKRFLPTFWIGVVGVTRSGTNSYPLPGGPMGVLVVQTNGGTVYKFYNPGVNDGDGHWRRI